MKTGLALLLALALLNAGCLGTDEPIDAAAAEEAATTEAPPSAAPAESASEPAAEEGPAVEEARVVPLSFDGSLPTFVEGCAFAVVYGVCAGTPGDFQNRFPLDPLGEVGSLSLTLTWDASSAATDELAIAVYSYSDSTWTEHAWAMGTSPLTLSTTEGLTLREGIEHRIGVFVPGQGAWVVAAGGGVAVATDQTFHIEGQLTLPPAAPNP